MVLLMAICDAFLVIPAYAFDSHFSISSNGIDNCITRTALNLLDLDKNLLSKQLICFLELHFFAILSPVYSYFWKVSSVYSFITLSSLNKYL